MFARAAALVLGAIDRVVGVAGGIALIIVMLTIFVNASGRYLLGVSFLGGEELARLLTVWITFVAAYVMLREDRHVSIDIVLRLVPPGAQRVLRGLAGLVGTVTMAYLTWRGWQLSAFSFGTGQMGTTLPVPRGLFFLPVAVGAGLMTVAFAEKFVRAITNTLPPLPLLAEPAPAAAKDETGQASAERI